MLRGCPYMASRILCTRCTQICGGSALCDRKCVLVWQPSQCRLKRRINCLLYPIWSSCFIIDDKVPSPICNRDFKSRCTKPTLIHTFCIIDCSFFLTPLGNTDSLKVGEKNNSIILIEQGFYSIVCLVH